MGMRFVKNESDSLMVPLTILLVVLGNTYLEKKKRNAIPLPSDMIK